MKFANMYNCMKNICTYILNVTSVSRNTFSSIFYFLLSGNNRYSISNLTGKLISSISRIFLRKSVGISLCNFHTNANVMLSFLIQLGKKKPETFLSTLLQCSKPALQIPCTYLDSTTTAININTWAQKSLVNKQLESFISKKILQKCQYF